MQPLGLVGCGVGLTPCMVVHLRSALCFAVAAVFAYAMVFAFACVYRLLRVATYTRRALKGVLHGAVPAWHPGQWAVKLPFVPCTVQPLALPHTGQAGTGLPANTTYNPLLCVPLFCQCQLRCFSFAIVLPFTVRNG